jgi:hypothetical protein
MANLGKSYQTAVRWADIVIERWQAKIKALDVIDTGALLNSFKASVIADANGEPGKVTFAFLYYGRFADMGAGGFRERKPWYSGVFLREVNRLGVLMATKYGYNAAEITAFNDYITI